MLHRSEARLLALVAVLVLVTLDVVLFPPVLSRVKSLGRPPESPAATSTARPAPSATPTPHRPTSISDAYNNVGIGLDGASDADFDGIGNSYSEQALTAVGFPPGTAVTSDGVQYAMPNVPPAQRDNVKASGQTIRAPSLPGPTLLGFLGAAEGGDGTGTVTVTYTDGTTQYGTLSFSDWTLGGGSSSPQSGELVAATSSYRDSGSGQDQTTTYLFASIPMHLEAGKSIKSVHLPATTAGGTIHVFSIGTDKGAFA